MRTAFQIAVHKLNKLVFQSSNPPFPSEPISPIPPVIPVEAKTINHK